LEKSPKVAEAKINHEGTILAVAWKDPAHGEPGLVNAAFEKRGLETEPLDARAREETLRGFDAGKWYGAADVDRLSEREAQVIAARLVKRSRLGLPADRSATFEKELSAAIAKHLTRERDEECDSKGSLELNLTQVANKYLDGTQLAELRKAAEK